MTMQSLLFRLTRARGEEMTASLWSFVYFFALLAGYYVLRPIRDEMLCKWDRRGCRNFSLRCS